MKTNAILIMLSGVVAVLPIGNAAGFGATLFDDDFESYSIGTFPSAGGWILVWNGKGTEHQVVSDASSFSLTKSLQLWGRASWSSVAQRKFSTDVPVIGYECAICIDSIGTGGPGREESVHFFNRDVYVWGRGYAAVLFNHDDGETKAEDGTVLGQWQPGAWYRVKVVLDRRTNTYDVWIEGELKGEGLSTRHSDTDLIDALALMSDHAGVKVYYDDAKVFTVDAWKASNPYPADGATDVSPHVIPSWDPPYGYISPTFDVYLGTNFDAVYNAKTSDPEYVGNVSRNQYHPSGPLDLGETYYWRADTVVPLSRHKGNVWSFTTGPLTRDDVVALVIRNLINPKTLDHHVIAFLDDEPLASGDTVTVFNDEGGTYVMDKPTWFVWIDDHPQAEFAHETRYVFVDVQTGDIEIHIEQWWPQLNGEVLWAEQEDTENPIHVIYSTVHLEL